jgi:hypothetical protein
MGFNKEMITFSTEIDGASSLFCEELPGICAKYPFSRQETFLPEYT